MEQDEIQDRLKKIKILPTFSTIIGEVIKVIDNPSSSASDLAKHLDPSMVTEILRIANTAYFGASIDRKVSTIEHAIAVIGWDHVSRIIIQMPLLSFVRSPGTVIEKRSFFGHSLTCGETARVISIATNKANQNETYVGGLVHDLGKIIICQFFRREWERIQSLVDSGEMKDVEAERAVLAFDHGQIGAFLLELWQIPRSITSAVMYHHMPEKADEFTGTVRIVCMADAFAKQVDMENDFESFDHFLHMHRRYFRTIDERFEKMSPSAEVAVYEELFQKLSEAKNFLTCID